MSFRSFITAAVVAGSFMIAAPAYSAVVIYTFTGVLSSGYDATGEFGAAGSDLTGLNFTAVFRRDDDAAGANFSSTATSTAVFRSGAPGPVLGALTIGGVTIDFGQAGGTQSQLAQPGVEQAQLSANDSSIYQASGIDYRYIANLSAGAAGFGTSYLGGRDYHDLPALSAAAMPGLILYGSFNIDGYDQVQATGQYQNFRRASGAFAPAAMTVTVTGVPEPQAWSLMILGFLGVGGATRRHRYSQGAERSLSSMS